MKTKNLLLGALTCLAFTACSSDEEAVVDNPVLGEDTYLSIQLIAANSGPNTRGTSGSDGTDQFENGTGDEATIGSADFFFYNSDGSFCVQGKNLSSLGNGTSDDDTNGNNEETVTTAEIVLEEITTMPTDVLAVINIPEGLATQLAPTSGSAPSLSEALALIRTAETNPEQSYKKQVDNENQNRFIMTNSTYLDGTNVVCATKTKSSNFQKTPELAKANPIKIHVERLAAKVSVEKATNITVDEVTGVKVNDQSGQTLTIEIVGWGLNALNKSAYYFKQINGSWTEDGLWTGWNAPDRFRSYWAKSTVYSTTAETYPGSYVKFTEMTEEEQANVPVVYRSWNDIKGSGDMTFKSTAEYCHENTYGTQLSNSYQTAATSVLLLAQMKVKDGSIQSLYRYTGTFYTEDDYIEAALNDFNSNANVWIKGDDNTYSQLKYETTPEGTKDVVISNIGDGKVTLGLSDALIKSHNDAVSTGGVIYSRSLKEGSTTEYEYTAITDAVNVVNNQFKNLNYADGFKDGMMYYNVPIEHLNRATVNLANIEEGDYGIVRNHLYKLTINKVAKLGTAIYDPDEDIIPNYDPDEYTVAAELHVLSWHVVNQGVTIE
ncbi:MAG: Mfa1 fimbrilin C-terminal domain-containing protein [Bacteroides sp.]|nr:Mfa1 fimbrilin C-terminal domain-containing protein [Bacteroides sp.]